MYIRGFGGQTIKLPEYKEDYSIFGKGKTIGEIAMNSFKSRGNISQKELDQKYFSGYAKGFTAPNYMIFEEGNTEPVATGDTISDLYSYPKLKKMAETHGTARMEDLVAQNIMRQGVKYNRNPELSSTAITLTDEFAIFNRQAILQYEKMKENKSVNYINDLRTDKIPKDELTPENYKLSSFLVPPKFQPRQLNVAEMSLDRRIPDKISKGTYDLKSVNSIQKAKEFYKNQLSTHGKKYNKKTMPDINNEFTFTEKKYYLNENRIPVLETLYSELRNLKANTPTDPNKIEQWETDVKKLETDVKKLDTAYNNFNIGFYGTENERYQYLNKRSNLKQKTQDYNTSVSNLKDNTKEVITILNDIEQMAKAQHQENKSVAKEIEGLKRVAELKEQERLVKEKGREDVEKETSKYHDLLVVGLDREKKKLKQMKATKATDNEILKQERIVEDLSREVDNTLNDIVLEDNKIFIKPSLNDYTGNEIKTIYKKEGNNNPVDFMKKIFDAYGKDATTIKMNANGTINRKSPLGQFLNMINVTPEQETLIMEEYAKIHIDDTISSTSISNEDEIIDIDTISSTSISNEDEIIAADEQQENDKTEADTFKNDFNSYTKDAFLSIYKEHGNNNPVSFMESIFNKFGKKVINIGSNGQIRGSTKLGLLITDLKPTPKEFKQITDLAITIKWEGKLTKGQTSKSKSEKTTNPSKTVKKRNSQPKSNTPVGGTPVKKKRNPQTQEKLVSYVLSSPGKGIQKGTPVIEDDNVFVGSSQKNPLYQTRETPVKTNQRGGGRGRGSVRGR